MAQLRAEIPSDLPRRSMLSSTRKKRLAKRHGDRYLPSVRALVAQLDRVLDYESRGRGFESSPARHLTFSATNIPKALNGKDISGVRKPVSRSYAS